MPLLNCCGFNRTDSPDPQPIRLVDSSQPKARFALSSHSLTPVEEPQNVKTIYETLPFAYEDNVPPTSSVTSGREILPLQGTEDGVNRRHSSRKLHGVISKVRKRMSRDSGMSQRSLPDDMSATSGPELPNMHDAEDGVYRRHSSRTLHGVAGKIRKRISRDSGLSRRSSKRLLKNSLSFEGTDRRAELKRALHQRVKNSLQEDSTADDDGYDEDAVPIKTPKGTWGRHEGTIQVSPRYLSEVLRRSDSPSRSLHAEHHQRELSEAYATNNPAAALSRMLTQRASHIAGEFENQFTGMRAETPKKSQSRKKYMFGEDAPEAVSRTRSPSLLGRSSTVLRSTPAVKPVEPRLMNPPLLHTLGAPPSPELLPVHTSSIPDSLGVDQWRLSSLNKGTASLPATLGHSSGPFAACATLPGVYDTRIRPASESWLHGASGLLGPSGHMKSRSGGRADNTTEHGHSCDPDNEESGFGGIDGKGDSRPGSIYHPARTRIYSEGSEPTDFSHIYNMHVPPRLVPQTPLTSISYPQLLEPRRKRSFSSGGSVAFHAQPQRQASNSGIMSSSIQATSSGLPSPGVPMTSGNTHGRATSSVYSSQRSQPGSLLSSQQSSLRRITTLQERLSHLKGSTPSEEVISVSASRGKSIDLDKLEQQSKDTDYHSSNESLMQRELAAADRRIVLLPRASTLPTKSRFREELEQISAEIALTNPFRRRVSNMDGNGEWNRASQAINGNQATSIWEKALREHSQEDTALSHTRLGSNSPGPFDRDNDRSSTSARKPSHRPALNSTHKHLSIDDWHGSRLQARLAAYKLPTPAPSPEEERPVKAIKASVSVPLIPAWTRYPSHTRSERSMSPAGERDQVYARDFANMTPGLSPGRQNFGKGQGSLSFSKNIVSSIKHIYRTQSQELQRRLANEARGHRSSVSEGGVLEYPELEMLGTRSPPMLSPDTNAKVEMEEAFTKANQFKASVNESGPQAKQDLSEGAKGWSNLYADCVVRPGGSEASSSGVKFERSTSEDMGPGDMRVRSGGSGSGSSELRASTLDFKKSLEFHEEQARERVLGPTRRYGA